jgi:ribonuclease HI
MTELKIITVNTDASFHPRHKVGGWAFWIVCDAFRWRKHGPLKSRPAHCHDAELMALGNAFFYLGKVPGFSVRKVVVNCDSKAAIHSLENSSDTPVARRVKKLVDQALKHLGAEIEFRHVRAHSGETDARSIVNAWCDEKAKAAMWAKFHGKKKQKQKPKPKRKAPVEVRLPYKD